jgi:hypothetical protein
MEVKILKEQLPVIQINFEEMKNALSETLAYYEGIVVAEDNLGECKEAQKELAGVRVKIDNYRKDKKKELSKPIIEFENQCKELIKLVEIVEKPIKDGIKIFDNKRREEKKLIAERIIKEVLAEYELNEKYAARLTIDERYCNLSIKEIEVKNDVEAKAMALKVEQNSEEELIEIIKDVIDSENERINRKIKFDDFQRYIDRGMSAKEVIAEIRLAANRIYEAENPKQEPVIEPIIEPTIQPAINEIEPIEQMYYASYKITGTHGQLLAVSKFLKNNKIEYEVTDQGEL